MQVARVHRRVDAQPDHVAGRPRRRGWRGRRRRTSRLHPPAVVAAAVPRPQRDLLGPGDQPAARDRSSSGPQTQTSAPSAWLAAISPTVASMSASSPSSGSVTKRSSRDRSFRPRAASSLLGRRAPELAAARAAARLELGQVPGAAPRRRTSAWRARRRRPREPVLGLDVEEPHLEVAPARPHRREQRGQVLLGRGERRRRPVRTRRTPPPGRRRAAAGRRTRSGRGRRRARSRAAIPGRPGPRIRRGQVRPAFRHAATARSAV